MRDDIDTASATGFLAALGVRASEEFSRRMAALGRDLAEVEADPLAYEAFRSLAAMKPHLREITMAHFPGDKSGAGSLSGTETIVGFVHSCFIAGRGCHAAPHVPSGTDRLVFRIAADAHAHAHAQGDGAMVESLTEQWLAAKARFTSIHHGRGPDGGSLSPALILDCIRSNERVESELEQQRAGWPRAARPRPPFPGGRHPLPGGEPEGEASAPTP